ncbi:glycosyltransferase family 2 protein [Macroventuria anomochaeta]|uniref:Glycosyltransferase family 2 protein n=1 Tax=Macroventuria anomochaeta TaxID=301207 RepID=A0ACB6RQ48_9PLEO|nr:glycosyltransferase family 2 protein [Macroventuria anomochaeta]KAF2624171.1 glycosyltransferase family 2 protein [Macroventuria anomochaeta]
MSPVPWLLGLFASLPGAVRTLIKFDSICMAVLAWKEASHEREPGDVDNKTTWLTSPDFLPLISAPFKDPKMGAVMPLIGACPHHHRSLIKAFYNFLGMTYLVCRHHECKADRGCGTHRER